MRRLRSRRTQDVADVVLAVAIAAVSTWTVVTGKTPLVPVGGHTAVVGPQAAVIASYVVAALALIWRRRAPLAVLAAVAVSLAVPAAVYGSSEGFGSIAPLLVALYTVGARCRWRSALLGLGAFTVFWAFDQLRDPLNPDLGADVGSWPVYLVGVIVWLAGMYVGMRRLYVAELRERAERAERSREERVRIATADERARIARELHDAVAHAMTVMVVQAEAADEMLALDEERARVAIQRIEQVGREGLAEMRRLLGVLRRDERPGLAPQPGIPALGPLVDEVRAAGLPVELTIDGDPRPVSAGVDISAFRIVQEALTNTLKHASASSAAVRLSYGDRLELVIVDDGVGRPGGGGEDGHGLVGMRERVALYGGTLDSGPATGGGFRIRAVLPIEEGA